MSQKAAFQLEKYLFNKVSIDLENKSSQDMRVEFNPSGIYNQSQSLYELKFAFKAFFEEKGPENPYVMIECIGYFKFEDVQSVEQIPSFFYRNAIAILFPYLRAFVSTVSLQANVAPVVLPTLNLSDLEQPLKENTVTQL
jgi:preprotein translocase subunit SecB